MHRQTPVLLSLTLLSMLTFPVALADEGTPLDVLPERLDEAPKSEMMMRFLHDEADVHFRQWETRYEERTEPDAIAKYQERMRAFFLEQIGGLPERTPLNAKITGKVLREGYSVEFVRFESQPGFHVTSGLFLPDPLRFTPPHPGVLVVCGHSANGKAYEKYQRAAALLALNGFAALIVDPVHQGERYQILKDDGSPLVPRTTEGHSLIGIQAILLGWNTARYEIWDNIRAIDYLQSRPEVDGQRIGCMGNSGGGTQTAYMMALEDRIGAAAPCCYITSYEQLLATIGPQDAEQIIFGQIAHGMDHADYLMMRAPVPTLVCCATHDFFDVEGTWASYRNAKRLYSRMGMADRIGIAEHDDTHGYHHLLQLVSIRFMKRWLDSRTDALVVPEIKLLDEEEFRATPEGQVMRLDGARSAFEINAAENRRLSERRAELWRTTDGNQLREMVRRVAQIRPLDEITAVHTSSQAPLMHNGMQIEKYVLQPHEQVYLPCLRCRRADDQANTPGSDEPPTEQNAPSEAVNIITILAHEKGKSVAMAPEGPGSALVETGHTVIAVDVRGVGETFGDDRTWYTDRFGPQSKDVATAYLLGRNYIGMRAEDLLLVAKWAKEQAVGNNRSAKVHLVAHGNLCLPALHAAYLHPDLFDHVELHRPLVSWSNLVETPLHENQFINVIHGALRVYDLSDLVDALGDKVRVTEPVDAEGNPLAVPSEESTPSQDGGDTATRGNDQPGAEDSAPDA